MLERLNPTTTSNDDVLFYLDLAQTYGYQGVEEKAVAILTDISIQELSRSPNYNNPNLTDVVVKRLMCVENQLAGFAEQAETNWTRFLSEYDSSMQRMCSDHLRGNKSGYRCNSCTWIQWDNTAKLIRNARGEKPQVAPYIKTFINNITGMRVSAT